MLAQAGAAYDPQTGYHFKRQEFDPEYDNDAEVGVPPLYRLRTASVPPPYRLYTAFLWPPSMRRL